MKNHLALLLSVLTMGFVASCAETVNTHGQVILPSRLSQIKVNETTRDEVLQLLGSPSSQGTMNDNRWYYITSTNGTKAFQPNILKTRKVLVIDFDPTSGKVIQMAEKSATDGKEVDPARTNTPTHGQSMGVVEQVLSNVGLGPK